VKIEGSVCAVTGAGRGIGRRGATDLAQRGATVYVCDVDVNLIGVFLCTREAATFMAQSKGGAIVNISSVSRAGNFGQTNYSATKAGVDAMTVTWSKELARYGIRVAAVAPGYVNTEMTASIKPELRERIIAQIPIGRTGEMSEISHAVRFIIENDFVTGRVLEVDGGLRL